MSELYNCVAVQPSGVVSRIRLDFKGMQDAVGGYVEVLHGTLNKERIVVSVNEEGMLKSLPFNSYATRVLSEMPDAPAALLFGTAVFVGDSTDDFGDLTEDDAVSIETIVNNHKEGKN